MISPNQNVIVVPSRMYQTILEMTHDDSGRIDASRTLNIPRPVLMREHVFKLIARYNPSFQISQ